jgi:hypothetical protein
MKGDDSMNLGIHTDYSRCHDHIRRAAQGLQCNIYNDFCSDIQVYKRQVSGLKCRVQLFEQAKFLDVQIVRAKMKSQDELRRLQNFNKEDRYIYKDVWLRNQFKEEFDLKPSEDISRDKNSGKIIKLGELWYGGKVKAIYAAGDDVFVETEINDANHRYQYYRNQFESMKKYDIMKAKDLYNKTHDRHLKILIDEFEERFFIKGGL